MQKEHWDPLLAWMKEEFDIELAMADGFAPAVQSETTKTKLQQLLESMDIWELAGQ